MVNAESAGPLHGAPTGRQRSGWALAGLWAALTLLLVVLFLLATRACGLSLFGGAVNLTWCALPTTADPSQIVFEQERLRERTLEDRLEQVRLRLVNAPPCPSPPEVEIAEAPPPPDIPEEPWQDQDLDVLEGCWQRISNLVIDDVDTGEIHAVRDWQMCFDADGTGEQRLEFENGAVCSGPIDAEFLPDGRLLIRDREDVPCDDNRGIYAHIAECSRLPDGTAECTSSQPEIGREGIPSTFRR